MPDLPEAVHRLIDMAVAEDLGPGDVTSSAVISAETTGLARITAGGRIVCCGLQIAREVFRRVDPRVRFSADAGEGSILERGGIVAEVEGPLRGILAAERTALNFLQRTCGVATLSKAYAEKASGRVVVLDSRKTIPGWRWIDKMAVRAGGCANHRMGLYDGILVKDNHVAACGGVGEAVRRARAGAPHGMRVEVEVEDLEGLEEAVTAGADVIMLDNFPPERIRDAVALVGGRALLEVSGGVTLENLEDYLIRGVDFISCGALTHSAPAVDIALEVVPTTGGA